MIVVNTSMNIAFCCFCNILGAAIYIVTPNPIASLGWVWNTVTDATFASQQLTFQT